MNTRKHEHMNTIALEARLLFFYFFMFLCFYFLPSAAFAYTIDCTNYSAWNDVVGWVNFCTGGGSTAQVTDTQFSGYANSNIGSIILDCATAADNDLFNAPLTCSDATWQGWKVVHSGDGALSGYAWNEHIGWINFSCSTGGGNCASSVYGVSIDRDGDFHGFAWNDVVGWISFNSVDIGSAIAYRVHTDWRAIPNSGELISSVIDTEGSVALQTVRWLGVLPVGVHVLFQIATMDAGATQSDLIDITKWQFVGSAQCQSGLYFDVLPDVPVFLRCPLVFENKRYIRYKVRLESNFAVPRQTPLVNDIIIAWNR